VLAESTLIAFVGSADLDRSREFYCDVLGLRLVEQSRFGCVVDANGTMLRITAVQEVRARPYTVLGWGVADIAATIAALTAAGVSMQLYDFLDQDASGIWTAPGGARIGWFSDPDGNTLSLTEFIGARPIGARPIDARPIGARPIDERPA
jgi:catechol 2,3-dioxygenase-like lactoylglutathione lyase family enzyme